MGEIPPIGNFVVYGSHYFFCGTIGFFEVGVDVLFESFKKFGFKVLNIAFNSRLSTFIIN